MSRYTTTEDVVLALRAPKGVSGAGSWGNDTYDSLIADCIDKAESEIDNICSDWAPFDGGAVLEKRSVAAGCEAAYGILSTDPFTALPVLVEAEFGEVDINWIPYHPVLNGSGKDLVTTSDTLHSWIAGKKYQITASWGHSSVPSGVKMAATRLAARNFLDMRNALGLFEIQVGVTYMPYWDPAMERWLAQYIGAEISI